MLDYQDKSDLKRWHQFCGFFYGNTRLDISNIKPKSKKYEKQNFTFNNNWSFNLMQYKQ